MGGFLTWGLFLMNIYIVLNHLLGHCQLLCLFSWVPAAASGTFPVCGVQWFLIVYIGLIHYFFLLIKEHFVHLQEKNKSVENS